MAFLIPLALAGVGYLVAKDEGATLSYQPSLSSKRSSYRSTKRALKVGEEPQMPVAAELDLQIDRAPLYRIPSEAFLETDNTRIAEGLTKVEDSAKARNDYNKGIEASDPIIKQLLDIVRDFIKEKKLVIYGGTALNALMPPQDQFYDYSKEIPDYDFFSPNAQQDAIELADRFYAAGFSDAQARSGVHPSTYKVSASFTQLADITQMPVEILNQMDIVEGQDGLFYVGPMYLRIDLYKQMAESGQPDRWPKVWKRMQLLNRNYPMPCKASDLERKLCITQQMIPHDEFATVAITYIKENMLPIVGSILPELFQKLQYNLTPELKAQLENFQCNPKEVALVDVFSLNAKEDALQFSELLSERYPQYQFKIVQGPPAKEIFSERWIVEMNGGVKLMEFLLPDKCLAVTDVNGTRFGTIDTMLAVMFSKLFVDMDIVSESTKGKQICLMQYLMEQIRDRVQYSSNTGEFARFPMECYGPQHLLKDIFKQRWQERVARLIAKHKGEEVPVSAGMFSYRPNDVALARQGLVDARLGELDFGQGKLSVI